MSEQSAGMSVVIGWRRVTRIRKGKYVVPVEKGRKGRLGAAAAAAAAADESIDGETSMSENRKYTGDEEQAPVAASVCGQQDLVQDAGLQAEGNHGAGLPPGADLLCTKQAHGRPCLPNLGWFGGLQLIGH